MSSLDIVQIHLYFHHITWATPGTLTVLHHHDGCKCPGSYFAPGHQQPAWCCLTRVIYVCPTCHTSGGGQHDGFFPSYSLTQKCGHFDDIFIAGCSASCHFDNFWCHQWWKFHRNDNISVSVLLMGSQSQSNNELCILLLVHSANDIVLKAIWFGLAGQFYVFWFWNGKFVMVTTLLSVENAVILTTLGSAISTKLATVLNLLFEVVSLPALPY